MLVSQFVRKDGTRALAVREDGHAFEVLGEHRLYDLAMACAKSKSSLEKYLGDLPRGQEVNLEELAAEKRLLSPLDHIDPTHVFLTGTGLTHLSSAAMRANMHVKEGKEETLTDSMKMFNMGLEDGKPKSGQVGVQPEWFYKGTGHCVVPCGMPIVSPGFALDGGEEPEIAGAYIVADDGTPYRVGYCLSNEFSDHVTEKINYLYLAHSKLRHAGVGPELLLGDLPADIRGVSRIKRGENIIFEMEFRSGEANMSHSIANLEHHHFKYGLFRHPGDVHIHMFGTSTVSFAHGVKTESGDVFEISSETFGCTLRNPLLIEPSKTGPLIVRGL